MKEFINQLTFHPVQTMAERKAVFLLRETNYRDDSDFLLYTADSAFPGEDCFDFISQLFSLKLGDEVIATCRLTPYNQGLWALEGLFGREDLNFCPDDFAHFNRILVDRRFRNRRLHDLMFLGVSHWGLTHNRYRAFFSICQVPFLRFYARYGVIRVNDTPLFPRNRTAAYHLIRGFFKSTYIMLRERLIKIDCLPSHYPPFQDLNMEGAFCDESHN